MRQTRLVMLVILVMVALGAFPAAAQPGARRATGGLGPSKASQLVELRGPEEPDGCPGFPSGRSINLRVGAGGSLEPFQVPAGQVLVLTSVFWDFEVFADTTGTVSLRLIQPDVADRTVFRDVRTTFLQRLLGQAFLPDIVVRPGDVVCMTTGLNHGGGLGAVTGFLAPDE